MRVCVYVRSCVSVSVYVYVYAHPCHVMLTLAHELEVLLRDFIASGNCVVSCYSVVTVLLQCCYSVVTVLVQCC
jgi:hypothetical protein